MNSHTPSDANNRNWNPGDEAEDAESGADAGAAAGDDDDADDEALPWASAEAALAVVPVASPTVDAPSSKNVSSKNVVATSGTSLTPTAWTRESPRLLDMLRPTKGHSDSHTRWPF